MAKNTSTNLKPNQAAALSYALLFVTGAIFLFLEKDKYVRFHAMQSILFSSLWFLIALILPISEVFWGIQQVINFGFIVIWFLLIYKAYKNEEFKLPVLGDYSKKWS